MSKSQPEGAVLTCTTGRSGTVYLTRVLQLYAPASVEILHEEIQPYRIEERQGELEVSVVPVPALEAICEKVGTLVVTGRIGMSVFAHDALRLVPLGLDVKLLFMVRSLVGTSLSWLRHLSRHQLGVGYLHKVTGPVWWWGHDEIRFNPAWSPFQIALWHWFMTYLHGMKLAERVGDENVRYLSFQNLGDVFKMSEVVRWVLGLDVTCHEQALEDCKRKGTFHATKEQVFEGLDMSREYADWLASLSPGEVNSVASVIKFMSGKGFWDEL